MLQGDCPAVNESAYFARTRDFGETVFNSLTVVVSVLGLILNILSLVVFVRVFNKAGSRNSFHLFLVFLSVCEVSFCLASAVVYTIMAVSVKGNTAWTGLAHGADGNRSTLMFGYSLHIPIESAALTTFVSNLLTLFAYLSVVSQFSRNCWVAITALLRCYVATRRTNVQVSQVYSLGRICAIFALMLVLVVSLSLLRSYLINPRNFLSLESHTCDTSSWRRRGILMLHVMYSRGANRDTVNMFWTLLSQTIPLAAIITSSILLVGSLRANSMVNSSERNKKITRMVFIFSLTFAVLEGPRAIVFFVFKYYKDVSTNVIVRSYQITYILSIMDSIVNVFIYFFNDQHFKKELCGQAPAQQKLTTSLTETVRLIETAKPGTGKPVGAGGTAAETESEAAASSPAAVEEEEVEETMMDTRV